MLSVLPHLAFSSHLLSAAALLLFTPVWHCIHSPVGNGAACSITHLSLSRCVGLAVSLSGLGIVNFSCTNKRGLDLVENHYVLLLSVGLLYEG